MEEKEWEDLKWSLHNEIAQDVLIHVLGKSMAIAIEEHKELPEVTLRVLIETLKDVNESEKENKDRKRRLNNDKN